MKQNTGFNKMKVELMLRLPENKLLHLVFYVFWLIKIIAP